jgi:DNA-binding NtrC family response regulator
MTTEKKLVAVLVVDDEISVLDLARHFLTHHGFHVDTAENGDECLKALEANRYDLLICDKNLPDVQGLQLLATARRMQPQMARLLMTGSPQVPSLHELDLDGYLAKPWRTSTSLAEAAQAAIDQHARRKTDSASALPRVADLPGNQT